MNAITSEHLNLLWKAADNKHEAYERAVYDLILDISRNLNNEVRGKIYDFAYHSFL